jgi:hypothetical protein
MHVIGRDWLCLLNVTRIVWKAFLYRFLQCRKYWSWRSLRITPKHFRIQIFTLKTAEVCDITGPFCFLLPWEYIVIALCIKRFELERRLDATHSRAIIWKKVSRSYQNKKKRFPSRPDRLPFSVQAALFTNPTYQLLKLYWGECCIVRQVSERSHKLF